MRSALSAVLLVLAALAAHPARAGCCDVRKIDGVAPAVSLRVCERSSAGACGATLFEGPLGLGQAQRVCTAGDTILYQEDLGAGFGPVVEAICAGQDIEI